MSLIKTFRKNKTDPYLFIRKLIMEQLENSDDKILLIEIKDVSNLTLGEITEIEEKDICWNEGIILLKSSDWDIHEFFSVEADLDVGMLSIENDCTDQDVNQYDIYLFSCPDDLNLLFRLEGSVGGNLSRCHYNVKDSIQDLIEELVIAK